MHVRRLVVLAFTGAVLVTSCAGHDGDPGADGVTGAITVYAATSLTRAFTDIGTRFEDEHPGVKVAFNFAGSSALVEQISQGAPADVFASADTANMDALVRAGRVIGTPQVFIRNQLEIVVARGNPKGITSLADLARDDVATVLCAAAVPCGNYARAILSSAGIALTPRSDEANVGAVVGRVANGEADAGIVYATDVAADDRVEGIAVPADENITAEYPIAVVEETGNEPTARAFVAFVLGPEGQSVLADYGFLPL